MLDPVTDREERFSFGMLAAPARSRCTARRLEMARRRAANLALAIAAALALIAIWRPRWLGEFGTRAAIRVLSIVVFVRFAIPVFVLGSSLVFQTFLAAHYRAANDALTATGTQIEALAQESESAARP